MKLRLLILLTTALCGLCTAAAQPAPEKTTPREGIFTFGPGTTISADRELAPLAEYAAEYLGCGVRNGMAGEGSVVLTLDAPDGEPSEAYTLDITPDHIQIGSSTCGGVSTDCNNCSGCCRPKSTPAGGSPREPASPASGSRTSRGSAIGG